MAKVNEDFLKLAGGYLFPEIARRTRAWQEKNPGEKVLRLGIGNTTEALTPYITSEMHRKIDLLSDRSTYTGYGDEQGDTPLRVALSEMYRREYGVDLAPEEFFVSDGAKADAANIQQIFSSDSIVAVQDPAYPVYVDSNVAGGRSLGFDEESLSYKGLVYMPSNESNGFVCTPPETHVDLIYLCFPNNPTGAVATKEQLKAFVDYAIRENAVIIYDAAYSDYIREEGYVHTIYEVEGAEKVAIEINSFSKNAGFTGVRLGYTVIPKDLKCGDVSLHSLWARRHGTKFNGAPYIIQRAGEAVYSEAGAKQTMEQIAYYKKNAKTMMEALAGYGYSVSGGINSPYVWLKTPDNMTSWDFFDLLLEKANVVGTPGSGFGPSGEGYFRLTAFGSYENTLKALDRIKAL